MRSEECHSLLRLMRHENLSDREVFAGIRHGQIRWAGNVRLKIYGKLDCWSGKRMHRKNRIFFASEAAAQQAGYRPCKHCMRNQVGARAPHVSQ